MHSQSYANTPGYLFICCGLILSGISSFIPHFEAGYKLDAGILFTGMLPYLVYGIAVPLFRSTLTTINGAILVAVHTWLVFNQRFTENADYSDDMIYYIPLIMTIVVIPLVIIALKKSAHY